METQSENPDCGKCDKTDILVYSTNNMEGENEVG